MKKHLHLLLLIVLPFMLLSVLSLNSKTDFYEKNAMQNATEDSLNQYKITVNFQYGKNLEPKAYGNIYVIWMESSTPGFIQHIRVCKKLVQGTLTGTALPYWKMNKYPASSSSEIDAVTSATIQNADFSVSAVLKDSTIRKFTLYFETDRSYEPNDWFSDQPALLYSANINLDEGMLVYELSPVGWTPNESTQNVIPSTPKGQLQNEMRYITHHKAGTTFGEFDELAATKMVERITATIIRPIPTKSMNATINSGISVYPNPTSGKVQVKSEEMIKEIEVSNMQGQTILHLHPETGQTSFVLSKSIAPAGVYFARITTPRGISSHKILITE